jgi:hypothetical protein
MLDTLSPFEQLVVGCLGVTVIGSILGILWYRSFAPSSFDRGTVRFIILMFSAIGAGGIILGVIMKH